VRDLIFSLFIAFIIMSALKPVVSFLEKRKIPRFLAVILVYLLALSTFGYLLFIIFPPLIKESGIFFKQLPVIIGGLSPETSGIFNFDSIGKNVPNLTTIFFNFVRGTFSNVIFVITTIFFGLYFLLEEGFIKKILINFFKETEAQVVVDIFDKAEKRMSAWVWGELVLMTVVGLLTFFGLSLIGMKFAIALAVLAGLLEIIPNIGPIISAIPAILIGLSQSYFLGFVNLILYIFVQQLENNLIVPLVMKKTVGLSPIVTLSALIIGGKLAGTLGIILAIPTTLFIETVLMEIIKTKNPKVAAGNLR